jgi:hypothetical protein
VRPEVGGDILEMVRLRLSRGAIVLIVVSDDEGCSVTSTLATVGAVAGVLSAVGEEIANHARGAYA